MATTFDFQAVDINDPNGPALRNKPSGTRSSKDYSVFWNASKMNGSVIFFLADPVLDQDSRGWFGWPQVYAQSGFEGGVKPEIGEWNVPVTGTDDPVYKAIVPYVPDGSKTGRAEKTMVMVTGANVLEVKDGKTYHKILVLSRRQWEQVKAKFDTYREMDPNWSATGQSFLLEIEGEKAGQTLKLSKIDAPRIDLPEPFDILEKLNERREKLVGRLREAGAISVEEQPTPAEEPYFEDAVYAEEAATAEESPARQYQDTVPDYSSIPAAKLRARLSAKNIKTSPRATHEELVALYEASL